MPCVCDVVRVQLPAATVEYTPKDKAGHCVREQSTRLPPSVTLLKANPLRKHRSAEPGSGTLWGAQAAPRLWSLTLIPLTPRSMLSAPLLKVLCCACWCSNADDDRSTSCGGQEPPATRLRRFSCTAVRRVCCAGEGSSGGEESVRSRAPPHRFALDVNFFDVVEVLAAEGEGEGAQRGALSRQVHAPYRLLAP